MIFVVGRTTISSATTTITVVAVVVEVEFWHVGVFVGGSIVLVAEELLFPPYGDREFKLSRVIRHGESSLPT